jgi:hypothetical protein
MALQIINGPKILAGETLSNAVDTSPGTLVRITMPFNWTPANLSFQISSDGQFFNDLFDIHGDEVVIEVVPDTGVVIPIDWMRGVGFIKFRSGRRGHQVPQEADREFSVALEIAGAA